MWRILHGISRGFRVRTPAPPSQTTTRTDENEGPSLATLTIVPNDDKITSTNSTNHCGVIQLNSSHLPIVKQKPTTSGRNDKEKGKSNGPSEADLLLREFFGKKWKKKASAGKDEECSHDDLKNLHMEQIRTGISMGTAWMTLIVMGRAVFGNWRTKNRRRQIVGKPITTWEEFENAYLKGKQAAHLNVHRRNQKSKCWLPRLSVLPSALGPYTVLAAGGDTDSQNSTDVGNQAIHNLTSISACDDTTPIEFDLKPSTLFRHKKSVTFDRETLEDEAASLSSLGEDASVPEEALEQFTEDTKNCSGATFNILGLQHANSGDHTEAFEYFRLGGLEGYAKSLFNLGLSYQEGLGVEKNMTRAFELYERAAFKGHTLAQYNLGLLLMEKGGTANTIQAIRLLEKAALKSLVQAQSYLGVFYTESGHFQNFGKAVKMFKMAAEQGDVSSKYHLGICYEKGLGGLKEDLSVAFDLYSSAATAGHLNAQYNMAAMLETGLPGVDKNPDLARELYQTATQEGHGPSTTRLKQLDKKRPKSGDDIGTPITEANKTSDSYNVYYSHGSTKSPRTFVWPGHPYPDNDAKQATESRHEIKTDVNLRQHMRTANTRDPPNVHISNHTLLIDDRFTDTLLTQCIPILARRADNAHSLSVFDPTTALNDDIFRVAGDSEAAHGIMNLRRVSTSPANLCFRASPLTAKPEHIRSLETIQ